MERSARLLINVGADINIPGTDQLTALHIAARYGYDDIVRALVRAPDVHRNVRDDYGYTPLHKAAYYGMEQSTQLLIDAGADINIADNDQCTALHIAARYGYHDIIGALVRAPHVNLNVRDDHGDTPLHKAAYYGMERSVRLLIDAGADINIADHDAEAFIVRIHV